MKEGSRIKDRPDIPYKEDAHAAAGNNGSSQGNTRDATKKGGLHDRLARESGPPVLSVQEGESKSIKTTSLHDFASNTWSSSNRTKADFIFIRKQMGRGTRSLKT